MFPSATVCFTEKKKSFLNYAVIIMLHQAKMASDFFHWKHYSWGHEPWLFINVFFIYEPDDMWVFQ